MPNENKLQGLIERIGEEKAALILQKVEEKEGSFKTAGVVAKSAGMMDGMMDKLFPGRKKDKKEEKYEKKEAEVEVEAKAEDDDEEEYVDPDTVEFLGLVSEAVAQTVAPAFEALAEEIDGLKTAKKEYEDKANAKISALEKVVKAQATALKELSDDTPRRFKTKQRASQSEDTVLTDQEAALKGAPTQDPNVQTFNDFFDFVRGQ